jgi:predicted nucleotidyltransferase
MKHEFVDLDYFLSKDKIVYLVKGYYHPPGGVFAYPVFWPDKSGDRRHEKWGRYKKDVSDFNKKIFEIHPEYQHNFVPQNTPLVPEKDILEVFHPRDKIEQFKQEWQGFVWYDIFHYLTCNLGILELDIGIFGSYLVGLNKDIENRHIKDVDFVIFGLDNFHKVKNGMEKMLKHFSFSHISKEHIAYHQEKFGGLFDIRASSFKKTLANKWSSIQIKSGLLNTLRFVYKKNEIPSNPIEGSILRQAQIKGVVVEDIGVNFMPRVFKIKSSGIVHTIVTYFWAFQSCVKNGDNILVTGDLYENRVIAVDDSSHGIKILD